MLVILAITGTLLAGIIIGLAIRGCLILGDRRQLDVTVQRLVAEARITAATRQALAAMRQATRDVFRS